MGKVTWILAGVVFVLVVVAIVFAFNLTPSQSEVVVDCSLLESTEEEAQCEQILSLCEDSAQNGSQYEGYCDRYMSNFFLSLARSTKDDVYCENLNDLESKDGCYLYVALATGDPGVCEKLSDADKENECLGEIPAVLLDVDLEDIPVLYRSEVEPEDYQLYPKTELVHVRIDTGPAAYSMMDEYHFASLDPVECEKVRNAESVSKNNDVYANCIKQLAEINGDYEICSYISVPHEFEDCIRLFALENNNAAACFEIIRSEDLADEIERSSNYGGFSGCVSKAIEGNPTEAGCKFLSNTFYDSSNLADRCYVNLAQEGGDIKWCENIKLNSLKQSCDSWLQVLNTEDCSKISSVDTRDSCYRNRASETADASYCGFISGDFRDPDDYGSEQSKESCYYSVLFDKEDVSVCHGIVNEKLRDNCYRQVNAYLRDGSDCDEIPGEFEIAKAWCYTTAASWYGQKEYCEKIAEDLMDGNRNIKQICLN